MSFVTTQPSTGGLEKAKAVCEIGSALNAQNTRLRRLHDEGVVPAAADEARRLSFAAHAQIYQAVSADLLHRRPPGPPSGCLATANLRLYQWYFGPLFGG